MISPDLGIGEAIAAGTLGAWAANAATVAGGVAAAGSGIYSAVKKPPSVDKKLLTPPAIDQKPAQDAAAAARRRMAMARGRASTDIAGGTSSGDKLGGVGV